jgi:cell division protein FtsB
VLNSLIQYEQKTTFEKLMKYFRTPILNCALIAAAFTLTITSTAQATVLDMHSILDRLQKLEQENQQLKQQYQELASDHQQHHGEGEMAHHQDAKPSTPEASSEISKGLVKFDSSFAYDFLDPTTNINQKQLMLLNAKKSGELADNSVSLQGGVTAIANYQSSNEPNLFGYLMRHPTANNQRGKTVSEATIHSAQLGFNATMGDSITASAELLFDPEQSFGAGTNTALGRNQVQVRRAYVLFGNLDKSPVYASLGKMAIPFGLTDTVSPFTASTVWHAFGGLANGGQIGYSKNGLNLTAMAVQGGAQFRAANSPVEGTSVPSKLNNFALDVNYEFGFDSNSSLLLGASYQKGSAYCQSFPITHFSPCAEANGAYDIYARWMNESWTLKGEFASTEDKWAGTFNPALPQFAASKVTSFDVGVQYRNQLWSKPVSYSLEFSNFDAGPAGSEWERQNQLVLGLALKYAPNVKLFSELMRVEGFAPLNFLSGGNFPGEPGRTHSDASAESNIFMLGVNAAF